MALTDKLKAIADAIRGKTGSTASVTLDGMVTEINNLPVLSGMNGIVIDEYWLSSDALPGNNSAAVGMPKKIHLIGDVFKDKVPDGFFRGYSGSDPQTYSTFYFLKSIVLPSTISSIGAGAFLGKSYLTDFIIPDHVTVIGSYAFNSVGSSSNLFSIILPASLITISSYAFYNAWLSQTIILPENLVTIGSYAFGAYYNQGTLPNKFLYHVIFPQTSLKTIGSRAFYSRMNLKEAVIPDSVTSLGEYAFYYCTSLRTIKLGTGITSIPNGCFGYIGTYGTEDITIEIPNTVISIGSRVFESSYLTSFIVPLQVTSIGYYCFSGCPYLASFECKQAIPMSPTGSGVVVSCSNLKSVILGGYSNPYNTTLLTSVSFNSCSNSALVITVYTEGALPLSTAPFGATKATIIYKDSTVEEEAA